MFTSSKTIAPNSFISLISEEYDSKGLLSAKDLKKEAKLKKSDSANAVESDSESGAAFMVSCDTDLVESEFDSLDFGDGDWFSKVVKLDSGEVDWFSNVEEDELDSSVLDSDSLENSPFPDTSDVVLVAAEAANPDGHHNTYV